MFQKILDIVDRGADFLITSHIDPDGDAIGSTFSFAWMLQTMQKNPVVYLRDSIPYMYEFLPKPKNVVHGLIPDGAFDAVFALDCGDLFRVGNGYERLRDMGPIVNIDHHATNEAFGVINLVDEGASSVGEILYKLFSRLEAPITPEAGVNLYTAILTDTGSFRYPNTNIEAFRICEEMMRIGVSPSHVAQMVYENHPKERFQLLGTVLAALETYNGDSVAIARVTQDMFRATGTTKEYTEGFVEFIKEIRGIDVAILMREINGQQCKVSMRSKGNTDVAQICNVFGGGGHRKAAGCTIDGTIPEVREKLKEVLGIR